MSDGAATRPRPVARAAWRAIALGWLGRLLRRGARPSPEPPLAGTTLPVHGAYGSVEPASVTRDGAAASAEVHGEDPGNADGPWNRRLADLTPADLLDALQQGWSLPYVVPRVLDLVEADPLASAGRYPGDLLRGLMEVRTAFWSRHARLYARYRDALRAGAEARRQLPPHQRLDFWLAPPPPAPPARQPTPPSGNEPVDVSPPDPPQPE
jgi:hypothetical protein